MKKKKSKIDKETKEILKKLDRNNKATQLLFKQDKTLLRHLRKEINAQQRRAS